MNFPSHNFLPSFVVIVKVYSSSTPPFFVWDRGGGGGGGGQRQDTVYAVIFARVLFSRISRARPSRKFPLQFMSIYSNDNIRKIAKLTTRELPQKSKNAKITTRK